MVFANFLSNSQKDKLRVSIKRGAALFQRFLANKTFYILCDDNSLYTVLFCKRDFLHFTGLSTNLSDNQFFHNAFNRKLDNGNILTVQHYDWNTLKKKAKIIARINEVVYAGGEMTLLLNGLKTHTFTFPIAIRNDSTNICVAFMSDYHARSIRTATSAKDYKGAKKINAILASRDDENEIDELVYIRSKEAIRTNAFPKKISSRLVKALGLDQ